MLKGLSLTKLSLKIKKATEEHIKEYVLAEQEKFYAEGKEEEAGENGDENEDENGK
jgi:hypothetical protein